MEYLQLDYSSISPLSIKEDFEEATNLHRFGFRLAAIDHFGVQIAAFGVSK
jgi:hypothetical protein